MDEKRPIAINDLYPKMGGESLQEAEANLRRYIAVMVRIYDRVRAEQGPSAATRLAYGDLTVQPKSANVPGERSNTKLTNPEIQ